MLSNQNILYSNSPLDDDYVDYTIILVDGKIKEEKYVKFFLEQLIPNLSDYLITDENDNATCFPLDFIPKTYKDCLESIYTFVNESEKLEYVNDDITLKYLSRYAKYYFNEAKKMIKNLSSYYTCQDCIHSEYSRYYCAVTSYLNENPNQFDNFIDEISNLNKGLENIFYDDKYIEHFKDNCRYISNYINNLLFCKISNYKFECLITPKSVVHKLINVNYYATNKFLVVIDSNYIDVNIYYSFCR